MKQNGTSYVETTTENPSACDRVLATERPLHFHEIRQETCLQSSVEQVQIS